MNQSLGNVPRDAERDRVRDLLDEAIQTLLTAREKASERHIVRAVNRALGKVYDAKHVTYSNPTALNYNKRTG